MNATETTWEAVEYRTGDTPGTVQMAEFSTEAGEYSAMVVESVKRPGAWMLSMTGLGIQYFDSEDAAKNAAQQYISTL
ncbi:hypothetical protein [Mycolicibacterium vinylchloridicum]|uniref:hypothetical protein n=1 Tax=Mycolicibacterium vinylchloridicum TaxID=2736928 RepID=UPI0015C7C6F3|nr:hypothetical protein [Mycolicibacterium vinylchloridicum]